MRAGIISAMRVESEGILREMAGCREEAITGIRFVTGAWMGREVVVAVSGVGKVSAAMCTQTMILRYAPDLIFNTGVAGGIDPSLSLLDVVLADRVVQHDVDTSALGDPAGMISGIEKVYVPCDASLVAERVRRMAAIRPDLRVGAIASGDQFITGAEKIREIAARFDAVAVDMESGAIGQVCYLAGMQCCIIRTISDAGDGMEYNEFLGKAAEKSIAVLRELLR